MFVIFHYHFDGCGDIVDRAHWCLGSREYLLSLSFRVGGACCVVV
jgi:hypothetical protein